MPRAKVGAPALSRCCLPHDSVRRVRVLLGANNFSRHNRYDRSAAATSATVVDSATELRITMGTRALFGVVCGALVVAVSGSRHH